MPEVYWVLVPLWGCVDVLLRGSVDVEIWVAGVSVEETFGAETSDLVLRYFAQVQVCESV